MLPSWSVVATVDEPAALVVAFALHHLNIGAAEVHIFLDGPNPEAQEALSAIPQVQVTLCDAAYWAASVRRRNPVLHTVRQQVNADNAYGRTKAEWLLHCDCDEFLRDGAAMAQVFNHIIMIGMQLCKYSFSRYKHHCAIRRHV